MLQGVRSELLLFFSSTLTLDLNHRFLYFDFHIFFAETWKDFQLPETVMVRNKIDFYIIVGIKIKLQN